MNTLSETNDLVFGNMLCYHFISRSAVLVHNIFRKDVRNPHNKPFHQSTAILNFLSNPRLEMVPNRPKLTLPFLDRAFDPAVRLGFPNR